MEKTHYRTIAVIPARGGSQRLPGKALIDFDGKPMIAHTIDAALQSKCFDKIVVSSDSNEILTASKKFGASTLERSSELSGPGVPTAPVLLDTLQQEKSSGNTWDILACLYATAPLRTAADIKAVLSLIEPGECDYAMAICEADRPVHQALTRQPNGSLEAVWPGSIDRQSEDLPRYLFGNGSTYAVSVPAFLASGTLYGSGLKGYEMPRERSVDLNTEADLALLRVYARLKEP